MTRRLSREPGCAPTSKRSRNACDAARCAAPFGVWLGQGSSGEQPQQPGIRVDPGEGKGGVRQVWARSRGMSKRSVPVVEADLAVHAGIKVDGLDACVDG